MNYILPVPGLLSGRGRDTTVVTISETFFKNCGTSFSDSLLNISKVSRRVSIGVVPLALPKLVGASSSLRPTRL